MKIQTSKLMKNGLQRKTQLIGPRYRKTQLIGPRDFAIQRKTGLIGPRVFSKKGVQKTRKLRKSDKISNFQARGKPGLSVHGHYGSRTKAKKRQKRVQNGQKMGKKVTFLGGCQKRVGGASWAEGGQIFELGPPIYYGKGREPHFLKSYNSGKVSLCNTNIYRGISQMQVGGWLLTVYYRYKL